MINVGRNASSRRIILNDHTFDVNWRSFLSWFCRFRTFGFLFTLDFELSNVLFALDLPAFECFALGLCAPDDLDLFALLEQWVWQASGRGKIWALHRKKRTKTILFYTLKGWMYNSWLNNLIHEETKTLIWSQRRPTSKLLCFRRQWWAPPAASPTIADESIIILDVGLGFVQ